MKISMLPLLFMVQIAAIITAALYARRAYAITRSGLIWLFAVVLSLSVWAIVSGSLAFNGSYQTEAFLRSWPAFWITLIPLIIIAFPLVLSPDFRSGLRGMIDHAPLHWLIGIHALRLLAVGGIIKAGMGEFSPYYAAFIGVPDMMFGLSAAVVAWFASKQLIAPRTAIIWNLIGALIIVPPALILLQMGLPGPWHTFTGEPSIVTIFQFPMALAPTLVVPIFVAMNLFVAVRLVERQFEAGRHASFKERNISPLSN